jgi:hypothetical protein
MISLPTTWAHGPMGPGDFDACAHQLVTDRTDPGLQFCTRCGESVGAPIGAAFVTAGDDLEPPFGHPARPGRWCEQARRHCDRCHNNCQWGPI